ncbi:hypothetical protein HID58_088418 [Brassica napus]|uniref:Uncharacterized protein n=1 Tax=Brassica napus TaxID=3708 RepID=A0ABQ7XXY3_BRANA|nr:hypothetical protein HID58_088418 [Brassica napus]
MVSSNRRSGVRHSTFESLRLGRSRITVFFLDQKMWLDKSVLSRALTLPKKQLESVSVSSLILRQTGVPASVTQPSSLSVMAVVPLASSLLGFPELQERQGVCGNHDVVGQIRSVRGSDLIKETTRVVIRLLIDP